MYVFRKLILLYAVVNRYLAMAVNFVYLKYLNSVHINYYTGILLKTLSYEPSFLRVPSYITPYYIVHEEHPFLE